MGYYVSHMIGIRTGGVFSGETEMADLQHRIAEVKRRFDGDCCPHITDGSTNSGCLSSELTGHKGSYVVIAGVFNYWMWETASEFSRALSVEFGTEVMHMCWDEQQNEVQTQIWLDGRPLFEVPENPLGRVIRRIVG